MCIVIDANALSSVFLGADADFKPLRDWVVCGKGKMVVGGTKYRTELGRMHDILKVVGELGKMGKVLSVQDASVDELEAAISNIVSDRCDDQHIIALAGISRCPLICSKDERAYPFFKDSQLYPWPSRYTPKIYHSANQKTALLTDENADAMCFTSKDSNPRYARFLRRCGCL